MDLFFVLSSRSSLLISSLSSVFCKFLVGVALTISLLWFAVNALTWTPCLQASRDQPVFENTSTFLTHRMQVHASYLQGTREHIAYCNHFSLRCLPCCRIVSDYTIGNYLLGERTASSTLHIPIRNHGSEFVNVRPIQRATSNCNSFIPKMATALYARRLEHLNNMTI
jgi:hypothetical protein